MPEHFLRFERVTSVVPSQRGLLATCHGEHLRVEFISEDVVRVKISRGSVFDEAPTFAVCADAVPDDVAPHRRVGRGHGACRDFTLWNTDVLDPNATAEFTAGRPSLDPRADYTSSEFDPYYVAIPFFYHQSHPAGTMMGSFVDNGYRATYDFSCGNEYEIRFQGGQYTEYIFSGPDMREILRAYTSLTGRTPLPPLWSLGYHQSRWFHYTQSAVEALGQRHRDNDIPCDALWLDIEYMDGYRVFTWDRQAFLVGRVERRPRRVGCSGHME